VLVVDDEPVVRRLTAMMLRELGLNIVEAGSGEEAVALLRKDPTAVAWVLVDASMPGMNGPSTVRALRAVVPTLPAVVVSGYGTQDVQEQFEGLDIRGILRKPFTLSDLQAQLETGAGQPPRVEAGGSASRPRGAH